MVLRDQSDMLPKANSLGRLSKALYLEVKPHESGLKMLLISHCPEKTVCTQYYSKYSTVMGVAELALLLAGLSVSMFSGS